MVHIKKLTMQGFKSFAKKTEFPFTSGINIILGPNGSGKSNVSDALCFVLGRLSIKSMRAAKARNLVFMGTKSVGPAKEATVEIIFDNSDKSFSIEGKEISIKRILKKNGQSIYKINNKTKTRQEILSLLAQAEIDPNGFNIILQGEIQNFVAMQSEERRKVIEEVAGISIYEMRKEKSLKELEKTENKLKEVGAILRERTMFLNNLEKEREAALKHKKLEQDIKIFKKSIIYLDLTEKKKGKEIIEKQIEEKNKEVQKIKKIILEYKIKIENLEEQISDINLTIQKQTGLEQEKLNQEIANFRADIAGLTVKLENHEKKIKDISRQKINLKEIIKENEMSIKELQKESPTIEKIQKELSLKKKELEELENVRKKYYMTKSELRTIKDRTEDKYNLLQNYQNESSFLLKQINGLSLELFDKKSDIKKVEQLRLSLAHKKDSMENLDKREKEIEKIVNIGESKIEEQEKIIKKIEELDVCPLCKSKITKNHINSINDEFLPRITVFKKNIKNGDHELSEIYNSRNILKQDIESIINEMQKRQSDLIKLRTIQDKNDQINSLHGRIIILKKEFMGLKNLKEKLEISFDENSSIEEKYETLKMEVEDISLRNKENLNSEISFKQREMERAIISIKQMNRDQIDLEEELIIVRKTLDEKEEILSERRKEEEILVEKAKTFIEKRDFLQQNIRTKEQELSIKNNFSYNLEQSVNNYKVERARINAEIENKETEILEFPTVLVIKSKKEILQQRLRKTEDILSRIGTVNMRALEVYDSIKDEYDSIREKVEVISKEKESVLKIIHQIDIKKKKAFLETLIELNMLFSRNFAQISTKGEVSLELENKKDPFTEGVNVIVKMGHGKYLDIKSLSGGEKTMVALSLIFAIQELKPYSFYMLDEIDAALDKRNSSRLGILLKKNMQRGQYLIITHNDEIITGATNLFGISMHEGISKVISLKV
jgi:chromosome segregation protein